VASTTLRPETAEGWRGVAVTTTRPVSKGGSGTEGRGMVTSMVGGGGGA